MIMESCLPHDRPLCPSALPLQKLSAFDLGRVQLPPACTGAGGADVSGAPRTFFVGGEGGDSGECRPYTFESPRAAGPHYESAAPVFPSADPDTAPGVARVPAAVAAKDSTASCIASIATVSSMENAVNGEGRGEGLWPPSRPSFGIAASSAVVRNGVTRMQASTVAPVPIGEANGAEASASPLPAAVGPGLTSLGASGLRGEIATFGAGDGVGGVDVKSTAAAPLIGKSTGPTIRKGARFVIGGRRVSSDEAVVSHMAEKLRQKQDMSDRLAAIGHKETVQERSHPLFQQNALADVHVVSNDLEEKGEGNGEGNGESDDGCGAQVSLGVCIAGGTPSRAVWSCSRGSSSF